MNSPRQQVPNMLLEESGEITPEKMKRQSQSENTTQLCYFTFFLILKIFIQVQLSYNIILVLIYNTVLDVTGNGSKV